MNSTLRSQLAAFTLVSISFAALGSPEASAEANAAARAEPRALAGDPDPYFALAVRSALQEKLAGQSPAKQESATAASLLEQARFAEEQERDFTKAQGLFDAALQAAKREKNADLATLAEQGASRAKSRAAGIAASAPKETNDGMFCRMANSLDDITRFGPDTEEQQRAYRDLALLGAYAVPWIEKALQGEVVLCQLEIRGQPDTFVRALAMMTAPEGQASLERLLSSPDPLVRRAVANHADPERQRGLLMRALKDPAEAVREQAIASLARSADPALFDTMLGFARGGTDAALNWLRVNRPGVLLQLAAAPDLSADRRRVALRCFSNAQRFLPDAAGIDALLAMGRENAQPELAGAAMEALITGINRGWRPLDPALLRRVEDALLAAPDAYPPQLFLQALTFSASAKGLATLIGLWPADDVGSLGHPVVRILGTASPVDFAAIVSALGKSPAPTSSNNSNAFVASQVCGWLERAAHEGISSAQIAAGARALPPNHRRDYVVRVVAEWIQEYVERAERGVPMEKLDPAFVELAREIVRDGDGMAGSRAIRALGAGGDPALAAEIAGYVQGNEVTDSVEWALRRLTRDDPKRHETVLRLLLSMRSLTAETLATSYADVLQSVQAKQTLAAATALWSPAEAERLSTLIVRHVPGTEGSQFLLNHWKDLGETAVDARARVIERFGRDIFDPALDLIGEALRDPSERVRNAAGSAFERYKNERQRARDFDEWRSADRQSQQTITELEALLANQNPDVVIGAVKALASLGSRSSLPKIIALHERFTANVPLQSVLRDAAALLSK